MRIMPVLRLRRQSYINFLTCIGHDYHGPRTRAWILKILNRISPFRTSGTITTIREDSEEYIFSLTGIWLFNHCMCLLTQWKISWKYIIIKNTIKSVKCKKKQFTTKWKNRVCLLRRRQLGSLSQHSHYSTAGPLAPTSGRVNKWSFGTWANRQQ